MKNLRSVYISLIFFTLALASCQKEPVVVIPDASMDDIVVPGGFLFEINKQIQVSVKLPITVGYESSKRIIEIWDTNSDGQPGKIIKTGATGNNGNFDVTFNIPITTKNLYVHCFAGWRILVLQASGMKTPEESITADFNNGYRRTFPQFLVPEPEKTTDAIKAVRNPPPSLCENKAVNGSFAEAPVGKMENWWMPMTADGIWYASDGAKDITSIISEEGNSFARIRSYEFTAGGFSQLVTAHAGQVVTFSGDSRGFDSQQNIHLFLLPRNANGENFEVYSYSLVNPGNLWTNSTVAATMPPGTVSCQVMFFSRATGLVDFDNAVVNVTDPGADSDGDLVPDWEDEYADNPAQAFNDYYPAKDRPGTLAFEDSWPQQEDYDFNDLVIDYQLRRVCNSNNKIVEIDFISQVRAIGTTTDSGFGFQLYLPTDLIAGIESDFKDTNEGVNLNENGTEMGQKWATFILFTHGSKTFPKTQVGSPTINSTMGYYFIIPLEYKFRIYLKEPINAEQAGNDKINPFLFKTEERSREVHLPGFPPTDLINHSLIGTSDDATSGESGILYQTKKGAPWALNLPIQWDYPRENTDILNAHLMFKDWITSGGAHNQDWYMDKDGYRNWDKIYRW